MHTLKIQLGEEWKPYEYPDAVEMRHSDDESGSFVTYVPAIAEATNRKKVAELNAELANMQSDNFTLRTEINMLEDEIERLKKRQLPDGVEWPVDYGGERIEVGTKYDDVCHYGYSLTASRFALVPIGKSEHGVEQTMAYLPDLDTTGWRRHLSPADKLVRLADQMRDAAHIEDMREDACKALTSALGVDCRSAYCDECAVKCMERLAEQVEAIAKEVEDAER